LVDVQAGRPRSGSVCFSCRRGQTPSRPSKRGGARRHEHGILTRFLSDRLLDAVDPASIGHGAIACAPVPHHGGVPISRSFLRGLSILEAVGERPATISQLAANLGIDKANVSRIVARGEAEGWLTRTNGIISLGPRGAALGRTSPERSFQRRAAELAHAVAGATGLDTVVNQLGGARAYILAHAVGRHVLFLGEAEMDAGWIASTAAGACLVAGLDDAGRDALRTAAHPVTVDEAWLEAARSGDVVTDRGRSIEGVGCLAIPWSGGHVSVPTTMSCIGTIDDVEAATAVAVAALRAAVTEGAAPATVLVAASEAV
jgi:DNA-binding IclR family transcriptional regulator